MNLSKNLYNYFLILFSLIPLSIIIGPTISLINIILIDISFLILLIYKKNFKFYKNNSIKYLVVLYIYLIFNTFIAIDFSESVLRNFGFLRIIIFFLAFNFFFNQKFFFNKMILVWTVILLIVVFDVFVEFKFGTNIFGYGENFRGRIVSFFKDEPIVGGYISGFSLIIIGFLLDIQKKTKKNLFIIFPPLLFLIAVILTGERSNTIKAMLGICLMLFFYREFILKDKIIFLFLSFLLILIIISNSTFLKNRFYGQIQRDFKENIYYKLQKSGFEVFKNNKIFGVGNKNYRIETCHNKNKTLEENKAKYICNTHPHQIYFEFLSEHGIFGTILLLYLFYKLIFSKIKKTITGNNYLKLGSLIYILLVFTPIIPSGAFFNDYLLTIFAINLSIFYASDKDMNIFKSV